MSRVPKRGGSESCRHVRGNFRPREGQVQRPRGGSWLRNIKEDEGLEQSGEGTGRVGVVHGIRCRAFVGP